MIFENREEWQQYFKDNWLAHYQKTGEIDWKLYKYGKNQSEISGKGVDVTQKRCLLISTAGAYLADQQEAFNAADPLGDYRVYSIPTATPLNNLSYAHEHYDHEARKKDPQVNLPLEYLRQLTEEKQIGSLCDNFISFSGYQPDVGRVIDETIPEMLAIAQKEEAETALFVPV